MYFDLDLTSLGNKDHLSTDGLKTNNNQAVAIPLISVGCLQACVTCKLRDAVRNELLNTPVPFIYVFLTNQSCRLIRSVLFGAVVRMMKGAASRRHSTLYPVPLYSQHHHFPQCFLPLLYPIPHFSLAPLVGLALSPFLFSLSSSTPEDPFPRRSFIYS